jgi:meiotically up-regulated gene 157 (Mug157) protein
VNHKQYGKIYAYETDGFSQHLMIDDANIPSLLSAPYLGFRTAYDPSNKLIESTRRFILSKDNPLFYEGTYASGIGSEHGKNKLVWPMSIIMEGMTLIIDNNTKNDLDYVWKRLEIGHPNTVSMRESFHVDDPTEFTREW